MNSSAAARRGLGALLVGVSYALSGLAAYAILSTHPDANAREGRHLIAGAFAIVSLAVVELLIAFIPLRRGERWAFWAAAIPMLTLVIPMMLLDAVHVPRAHLTTTMAPFIAGLLLSFGGLLLAR
ncbi:MAG: hypothetical protein WAQ52_03135 [Terriglobales bacterium]